ncbi:unnamed protein product [Schistocephalus solidus]|uniref:LIM zinc-binding domain-containing protein n=1 Tax=Schistocephalus solidus TaxID=70667 RepID=A0A183TMU6_SCHSO|nr:unnamed protein product [Schistocephalus solidus]
MSAALGHSAAFLPSVGDYNSLSIWSVGVGACLSPPVPPSPARGALFWQRPRLRSTPVTLTPPKPLAVVSVSTPVSQRLSTTVAANLPLACSNCRLPILQRQYLCLNDGRPWHSECLLCCQCRHPLGMESRCYVREGRIYCKYDYQR